VRPHLPAGRRTSRRSRAALLATVLLAGCGEPLGPEDVAGTYVLRSVAGELLPAVAVASDDATFRIVADTLRLRADGTGRRLTTTEIEPAVAPAGGNGPEVVRGERALRFRVVSARVEIEYVCGINEMCVAPPHLSGRRGRGELRIDYALGGRVPLVYGRIGERP
jgi:hypothetical protein